MRMFKICFLFIVFSVTTILLSGAVISEFQAEAGINQVVLKWIATAETNLKGYQVWRSLDGVHFEELKFIECQKNNSEEKTYKYIDRSVFKPTDRTFYYKLYFLHNDDTSLEYDKVVVVEPKISGAKHTWGSIKAMFR